MLIGDDTMMPHQKDDFCNNLLTFFLLAQLIFILGIYKYTEYQKWKNSAKFIGFFEVKKCCGIFEKVDIAISLASLRYFG